MIILITISPPITYFLSIDLTLSKPCIQYYLANYLDPPIHNNAPPVVGKISWAKVLSKKLENPMHHFMNYSSVMKDRFTKRIVFMYNILQQVLVEFELVYHKAWTQFIYSLKNSSIRFFC